MFSDLLNETKGFKYQITVKVLLKKYKLNEKIEFDPIYFNSMTKTTKNHIFRSESSFQRILYIIHVWINKGSGWIFKSIESQYINILTYRPLSGSSYIDLPVELRSPSKGLINIKNKNKKCFYGVMLGILILHNNIQKELKKLTKKLLKNLIMMELSFLGKKKILARLRWKTIYALTCLVMKMSWFFQFMFQIKNLKTQWICYF